MTSIYQEIEIDLSIIDTCDLIEELESRGEICGHAIIDKSNPLFFQIEAIYNAYNLNQDDKTDALLRELFYDTIGRIAR